MELKVITVGKATRRDFPCPVCGHSLTVTVSPAEKEGTVKCWQCESMVGWDASDEFRRVIDEKS